MESSTPLSFSVSIVCYNTPKEDLDSLLSSLNSAIENLMHTYAELNVDIYFVDNSETSAITFENIGKWQLAENTGEANLRILHGHGNIGYGAAHNLVVNKLESDFHLVLNPDVVLDPDSLKNGVSYLLQNDKTVMVSPLAYNKAGNKQHLCKRYPSVLTFLVRGFLPEFLKVLFRKRLARFEMHELSESESGIDVPIISCCFMLCKTKALQELNGFDQNYFLYFEDFDLSMRAASKGRLDYLPSMKIVHGGGHTAKKGIDHLLMFAKSGIRFFNSHGWRIFKQD